MSVINTMLHNLDERRASPAVNAVLPGEVIALPRARRRAPRKAVVVITVLFAILVLAILYFWPVPKPDRLPKPIAIAEVVPDWKEVSAPGEANKQGAVEEPPVAAPPVVSKRAAPDVAATTAVLAKMPEPQGRTQATADKPAGQVLKLATTLSSRAARADTPPPARAADRPGRETGPAQSLVAPPAVVAVGTPAVVGAANAAASIRLEQSTQTPQERNLAEVQRAADLQRRGALAEAEASLRGVLDNDKGMVAARLALFSLLSRQQRNDEARKILKDGLDATPTQPQLLLPYARLMAARGEWSAANEALVPAADALAQDAEYRALNGAVLQRLSRFPQSSAEYRAALRMVPTAGAWWVGLGLSLEGEGKQIEARNAYLQARNNALGPDLAQYVDNKLARLGPVD